MSDRTARLLGADEPSGSVPVLLFIPALDRDGHGIDQEYWVEEALTVLGKLFGGGTALPPGRGVWNDVERGQLMHEPTVVVFSLAKPQDVDDDALISLLGDFMRRLGREASQGEVGVVVGSEYFGISNYDV